MKKERVHVPPVEGWHLQETVEYRDQEKTEDQISNIKNLIQLYFGEI
jgi:hypothetical protein